MEADLALGIDLGGTNLRVGVVRRTGELADFAVQPIDAAASGDALVAAILRLAQPMLQVQPVTAAGIALAGVVPPEGVIDGALCNLPGLHHYPLAERLAQAIQRPCQVENDALLALLGEARYGAAQDHANVLLLTLGTGIGGALMLDGRLRKGPHGIGCEIGMLPFPDPTMENLTPLEHIASPRSVMQRLGDPHGHLYQRAVDGDPVAQAAAGRMHRYLGWLVTDLHLALDLELVLLSGGLAAVGQPLLEGVRAAFTQLCPPALHAGLRIDLGRLPQHSAGVIGAASLAFSQTLPGRAGDLLKSE